MTSDVFGKVTPVDDVETDCDQQHAEHQSAQPRPQSLYCPLSEAETRRSHLTHAYSPCHRCSAATDNGNLKHMANLIADRANVDDRKWPHVAAMLNGWHTDGSVT